VGSAGVLAIPLSMGKVQVLAMVGEARAFAAEWVELRAIHRNRLHGYCLRSPLKVSHPPPPFPHPTHCLRSPLKVRDRNSA